MRLVTFVCSFPSSHIYLIQVYIIIIISDQCARVCMRQQFEWYVSLCVKLLQVYIRARQLQLPNKYIIKFFMKFSRVFAYQRLLFFDLSQKKCRSRKWVSAQNPQATMWYFHVKSKTNRITVIENQSTAKSLNQFDHACIYEDDNKIGRHLSTRKSTTWTHAR